MEEFTELLDYEEREINKRYPRTASLYIFAKRRHANVKTEMSFLIFVPIISVSNQTLFYICPPQSETPGPL